MLGPTRDILQQDVILRNARVPVALIGGASPGSPGGDGLVGCDIVLRDGRIMALTAAAEAQGRSVDLDHGQVWPLFVDMHTHLDKGHIWPRAANPDGTHASAVRRVAADRAAHWSVADMRVRFEFGLRCAYAYGTGAIRTHLDCYEPQQAARVFGLFSDIAREWQDRIELQAAYMTRLDTYEGPAGEAIAARVAAAGGVLGGILKFGDGRRDATAEAIDRALARLLALATAYKLDIDLHVDETLDPEARTLAQVARAVIGARFSGQVTCGHCCSLAAQPTDSAAATIALVREAGLSIVCLPMVNLYLQGREAGTPRWRGLTLVHELAAAGVPVAIASDNCRDPFFPFGDHDMLEVYRAFVRTAHAERPAWQAAITTTPADIMKLSGPGRLGVGQPADLVLFRARTANELLSRPQSDRIVLRRGKAIDARLPDYRELDGVFATSSQAEGRRQSARGR